MTLKPAVSVNLCLYNAEPYLRETLDAVYAQSYKDFEIVIVNDGSKDKSEEIVRSFASPRRAITYHSQPNAGLGAARNKALSLSSGEFIAILDQDDVWEKDKLAKQIQLFSRPEVGFVGSDARFMDSSGGLMGLYSEHNTLRRGRILKDLFLYNFVACAGVVLRRTAIDTAGGFFRPEFRIAEEYELFLRLAEKAEFDFVPEALVRVRVHAASAGWDAGREREEMRRAYEECLGRNPGLAIELGAKAVAIKRAGLWLTPDMAAALKGDPAPWSARVKAGALAVLASLGPAAVDRLVSLKRAAARLRAASA